MAKNDKPLPPITSEERAIIDAIKSDVQTKTAEVQRIEARIAELKAELEEAHYAVSKAVSNALDTTWLESALKVASVIYWTYDDIDVRRGIASSLDIDASAIVWRLYKVRLQGVCDECGNECTFEALSWSQVRTYKHLCQKCTDEKEAAEAARDAELDAQIEARNEELRRLRSMPYAEYLKTEHWQEVRKAAIKRAKFRCQTCNANKPLQVHHRTYERRGQEYSTDVIALCADCHKTFHENGKIAQRGE
jgi:5-methylcytosine-specific restriction endonuclease McrA